MLVMSVGDIKMMFTNLNFFYFTNLTRADGAGVDIDPKTTLGPTPLRKFGVSPMNFISLEE